MAALINRFSGLPMDFQNLMSCIQCHDEEKNSDVIVETMKTIVSICSEEEFGKDAFRDVGGLDFLMEFITNTDQVAVLEYGLKVLAYVVDGNVHNQMHLTDQRTFTILQAIFNKEGYPISIVKNAAVLFSTILYQNRSAQDLLQEDAFIQSLMNQYKKYAPIYTGRNQQEYPYYLDVWLNINSTLCFAVNNPLNEKNQGMCSVLFPLSLRIIETSTNPLVTEASSSFLSLCIANNEKNQGIFAENEGLLIFKRLLNKNFELLKSYMRECNNIVSKVTLDATSSLISIISAAVLDHEKNAALCGKLGIVSQMIELLAMEVLNNSSKKKLILALGYSIDAYSDNRFIILDVPHFDSLLKSNLKEADVELHSAAKYLLQVCLRKHGNELFMRGTKLNGSTECTNPSLFLKSYKERLEDAAFQDKDSQEMSPQLQQKNFQNNAHHQKVRNESVKTFSKHEDDRASYRNTDELSCSSKSLILQKPEIAKKLDKRTTNLFLLNSKAVNYQNNADKYADQHSNKDDENSECDSLSKFSLQSAEHLFKLNRERMKAFAKNKIKKPKDLFRFSKNGDYYTSSDDREASEDTDTNSVNKKIAKRQTKDKFLDRKNYLDKLFSNGSEAFSKPYLPSQRKKLSKSGNCKAGEYGKIQNRMAGCMQVIVLPGTKCPEHKLAAHFEMLKVCSLSE